MYFWAIVFLIATTLVAIFKKDGSQPSADGRSDDIDLNVGQSYRLLLEILKLKPVQYMAMILLTVKVMHRGRSLIGSIVKLFYSRPLSL